MASYQIQVRGEWAGSFGGWRPAIDGIGETAAEASTFADHDEAQLTLDNAILPLLVSDPADGDVRDNAPTFRIVEVQS